VARFHYYPGMEKKHEGLPTGEERPVSWDWGRVVGEDRAFWETSPAGAVVEFAWHLRREGKRRVYDLGCGLGRHLVLLAEMGFDVAGSDLSPLAVAASSERLAALGLPGRVREGEMTAIDEPASSFDAVLSYNVLYHALPEGIARALDEVRRILRPGGLFLVTLLADTAPSFAQGERIGERTILKTEGPEERVPHTYLDREGVLILLREFSLERLSYVEQEYDRLARKGCHYVALARKG